MLSSTTSRILKPVLALLVCALADASPLLESLHGYDSNELLENTVEGVLYWEVHVTPGSEVLHLNGTAEQVHDELIELSPHYRYDFDADEPEPMVLEGNRMSRRGSQPVWKQRGQDECEGWFAVHCDTPGTGVRDHAISEGVDRIRGFHRAVWLEGNTCATASCSRNSAIHWCNIRAEPLRLETFDEIADGAKCIQAACNKPFSQGTTTVKGRANHAGDGWYVVLEDERC